jgi:hypothetical protein
MELVSFEEDTGWIDDTFNISNEMSKFQVTLPNEDSLFIKRLREKLETKEYELE